MPEPPPLGSASQLVAYAMCPRKYRLRYIDERRPEHRSTALLLGTAVHGAIGYFFEERLAGREAPTSVVLDILAADLLAEASDATVPVRWKDATFTSLREEGERLVGSYLERHRKLDVAEVETPFEVPLMDLETGEVVGRPYRGFFDLVLRDRTVVELKTSARDYPNDTVLRHLQLGMYAYAQAAEDERPAVRVDVIVKLKRDVRVESHAYPSTQIGWWFAAAVEIERGITAGVFPPSPGPLCIECEYRSTCLSLGADQGPHARPPTPYAPAASPR